MRPFAAVVRLAVTYAVLGIVGTFVLSFLASGEMPDPAVTAVLVATMVFAASVITMVAVLTERWLRRRLDDADSRRDVATMVAAGLVLLSGLMTIDALGFVGVAAAGVLALATHVVLRSTVG